MTVRRRETVHRLRYFRFCNVLHIWTIRAIPTYRVYRLYDNKGIFIGNYIFDYLSARCMWTSPACSIEVGVVYVVLTCTREREIIATILCLL